MRNIIIQGNLTNFRTSALSKIRHLALVIAIPKAAILEIKQILKKIVSFGGAQAHYFVQEL